MLWITKLARSLSSESTGRWVQVLANVATILGIIFAVVQLRVAIEVDRRQTTANVLRTTRDVGLLQAIRRLEQVKSTGRPAAESWTEQMISDRDFVLNTYDSLAIYLNADTLDACLVKAHTLQALDLIVDLLQYLDEPPSNYSRISYLRTSLTQIECRTTL